MGWLRGKSLMGSGYEKRVLDVEELALGLGEDGVLELVLDGDGALDLALLEFFGAFEGDDDFEIVC